MDPGLSQLAEPMVRIWGLSLLTDLTYQVGPRGRKTTETHQMGTVGLGSIELDLEHTDGTQQELIDAMQADMKAGSPERKKQCEGLRAKEKGNMK